MGFLREKLVVYIKGLPFKGAMRKWFSRIGIFISPAM